MKTSNSNNKRKGEINMNNEGYYFSYSFNQFKHLERAGIKYIATGFAISNGNHQFWMYKRNDQLDKVLKEYKQNPSFTPTYQKSLHDI